MNTRVIATINPFDMQQQIMIFENDKCINKLYTTLDNLSDTIYGLNKEYKVNMIEFCGVPQYVNKYVKDLKTKFANLPEIVILNI